MKDLEKVINEINSLIVEQSNTAVIAPKDEYDILTKNEFLMGKGYLVNLCAGMNGTPKPVIIDGKTYFAARKATNKDTKEVVYITYDGFVLKQQGNTCNYTKLKRIKGIQNTTLQPYYDDLLRSFGIKSGYEPYYYIKFTTNKINEQIAKGARSKIFQNWRNMLSYWFPMGDVTLKGNDINFQDPTPTELQNYTLITADNLGINFDKNQIRMWLPKGASTTSDTKLNQYTPESCRKDLVEYLGAAFEYNISGDKNPNININVTRKNLQICTAKGKLSSDTDPITITDFNNLGMSFSDKNNPFKGLFKGFGNKINFNEISKLLTGKMDKLPLAGKNGKNPYLDFNIEGGIRESQLNKLIIENLNKITEEKKHNLLLETKIVRTRVKILTEKINLKSKNTRERFFDEIITELIYLESQKFDKQVIKEEFGEVLKGLFGQNGSEAIFGTFKEYMAKWLLKTLTPINPNGWIGSIIIASIGNLHFDDITKITDCDFIVKKLSLSIGEGIARKFQNDKGLGSGISGGITDVIRNGLFGAIDNNQMVKSLESGLSNLICPSLSNVKTKLQNKTDQLKTMALQA